MYSDDLHRRSSLENFNRLIMRDVVPAGENSQKSRSSTRCRSCPENRRHRADAPIGFDISFVVVALVIIVATRGRLSSERYQRETALPAPVLDREQEQGEARASV